LSNRALSREAVYFSPAQLRRESLPVPPIDDQLAAMPANSVDRTPSMEASRRPTSAEIY
jgi:hypothetical protein